MKLNLGAGNQPYEGYIGVSLSGYAADVIHDLSDPLPYPDSSVEEIFANHLLEHFPLWQIPHLLHDWYRVLQDRGILWGFVPDGPTIANLYLEAVTQDDWRLRSICLTNFLGEYHANEYAGPGQIHYAIYDKALLELVLARAGFSQINVAEYRFSATDHRLGFVGRKGVYPVAPIDSLGAGLVFAGGQL